jgi:hypothetical protein
MNAVRLVPLALAAALACSARPTPPAANDPACSDPTRCPNDPAPTGDQVDTCERALASACGPQYRAYLDCATRSRVCDVAGHTDPASIDTACSDPQNAYAACVAGPPDAGM